MRSGGAGWVSGALQGGDAAPAHSSLCLAPSLHTTDLDRVPGCLLFAPAHPVPDRISSAPLAPALQGREG